MRVSIVATALDGQTASNTGVVNMVNRIQNRNSGYSDAALFSKGAMMHNNSVSSSISGATALKLDEQFEVDEVQKTSSNIQEEKIIQNNYEDQFLDTTENNSFENDISIELPSNETSIESNSIEQVFSNDEVITSSEEEYTPKLFSEDTTLGENKNCSSESEQKLFNQENNQEEDFEIPAFLRRQKF